MVQGVDVWLNNPRRPLEASGTSGMKASANGVVNLSVLDGWWDEGWDGHNGNDGNGWAIGGRETNPTSARRTKPTRRIYTSSWSRKSCRSTTSATGAACRRLDGRDETFHRQHDLAILVAADAPRVHRAYVPPCQGCGRQAVGRRPARPEQRLRLERAAAFRSLWSSTIISR